jgi:ABC-type sulfate transport system substrate-binding protein
MAMSLPGDWSDLVKPGIQVITPNPKTSGGARWNYLAAWGYVKKKGGTDADAADFVSKLYKNVPVLAKGGRDATTIFLQRNIGDVLVPFLLSSLDVAAVNQSHQGIHARTRRQGHNDGDITRGIAGCCRGRRLRLGRQR